MDVDPDVFGKGDISHPCAHVKKGPQIFAHRGPDRRCREHALLDGCLIDHIDEFGTGDRSLPVSNRILRFNRIGSGDIEPIVFAKPAVPSIASAANLDKVMKPHLDLRRVAGNRYIQAFWRQCRHHSTGPDLLQQPTVDEFTARMEPNQGFNVPNLGATPVSPAAGQSLRSKLDPKAAPSQDFTLPSLPPVRQKLHDGLGSECCSCRLESRFGPRPLEIRFHSQSLLRGWALKYRALRSREKIGDLSDGGCDVAHSTFTFFRRGPQGIRWLTWPQREFAVSLFPNPLERAVALSDSRGS